MLKDIFDKIKNNLELTEKEIKYLAEELGSKMSLKRKILFFVHAIMILFLCILPFLFFDNKVFPYLFILPITYLLLAFFFDKKNPFNDRIREYFHLIDQIYREKLSNYEGYKIFLTANIPNTSNHLSKDTIMFISDGYNFICYNDFLNKTKYSLIKYKDGLKIHRILKVIDPKAVDNKPLIFKLQEIESYKLVKKIDTMFIHNYDYKEYSLALSNLEYKNIIEIELKNHKILKFGENVLEILRNSAPLKEIKDNE